MAAALGLVSGGLAESSLMAHLVSTSMVRNSRRVTAWTTARRLQTDELVECRSRVPTSQPVMCRVARIERGLSMIRQVFKAVSARPPQSLTFRRGSIFVEYLLLVTIVGIGVIVGLACLREALVNELVELANAINAIVP
jgi:hypothetical protein